MEVKFSLPAEWEKHKSIWLAWPYDAITFPDRIKSVEERYCEIIKAVEGSEAVNLLVKDDDMKMRVRALLEKHLIDLSNIAFFISDYADVWMRDYAPMFVKDAEGKKVPIKWNYNAYGGKFPDLLKDNEVFTDIAQRFDIAMIDAGIVMEGGALEYNGAGTLLTTEQCLLNQNRNPELSKERIEATLKQYTGTEKIIWLKEGIVNDHTDGHVDDIAKFINPTTIMCAYEDDENDPNFTILDANFTQLQNETDASGNPFTLIKLPMPHMNYDDGEKAPASYVNFYIGNSVVIVPTFSDPNDARALEIIKKAFPEKKTVSIDCSDIIYGGGAIHCITHEEPAA